MQASRCLTVAVGIIACLATSSAHAQYPFTNGNGNLYQSYFEAGGQMGDEHDLVTGTLFVPLWQSDHEMLFTDIRGQGSEAETYEGNWGFGYRNITHNDWVLGRYVFFDRRRTVNDNYLSQVTVGLEMLNVDWDFRINGYLPDGEGKGSGPFVAGISNSTIVITQDQEFALGGVDTEIGCLLGDNPDGSVELRGYIGGYYFDRDETGIQEITGPRARLELRLFDLSWLGPGSRVVLGGQFQNDRARGNQGAGILTVRIPFGREQHVRSMSRLQRRMLNPIVRDVDIVSQEGVNVEVGIDPLTNQPFQPATMFDANTADIAGQVAAADPGMLVIPNGEEGQIDVNTPITLQPGMIFRNAGFTVRGQESGGEDILGVPAVVNGTDANQDILILADNIEVRDSMFTGGRDQLAGAGISGLNVHDNSFSNAGRDGARLTGAVGGNFTSNTFSGSGNHGLSLGTHTGNITSNTLPGNAGDGIVVANLTGDITQNMLSGNHDTAISVVTLTSGSVSDNSVSGTTVNGIAVSSMDVGTIANNSVTGSTATGFNLGVITSGVVAGNTTTDSAGFVIDQLLNGTVSGNTATRATVDGFAINTYTNGIIRDNIATDSGEDGFHVALVNSEDVPNAVLVQLQMQSNTATGSGMDGFRFDETRGTEFDRIDDNIARNNGGAGFRLGNIDQVLFATNTAEMNTGDGFVVQNSTDNARVVENISNQNGGNGFTVVNNINGMQLSRNTANGNVGFGADVTQMGATISDNTFTNNGLGGLRIANINNTSIMMRNNASSNTGHGVEIQNVVPGLTVVLDGTITNGNTMDGVRINRFDTLSGMYRGTSNNNGGNGYTIGLLGSILLDNSADNNGGDGFNIGSDLGAGTGWAGGSLTDNTSTNNTLFGFRMFGAPGTSTNNTATGNGVNNDPP